VTVNVPPPNLPIVTVSTDGACVGDPTGAIGWAWVNHTGSNFDSGGAAQGSAQIAELTAVLQAIKGNAGAAPLLVEAESQYAYRSIAEWREGWKRNNWVTASGDPIENLELIQAIDAAIADRQGPVRFRWVRSHVGHKFNERAVELAELAARDWAAGRGEFHGVLIPDSGPALATNEQPRSGATNIVPGGAARSKAKLPKPEQPTLF